MVSAWCSCCARRYHAGMEQGDQPSRAAQTGPEPHWNEYRVGFLGELASMFSRTLGALAVGAVLSFLVVFIPAFALEDSSVTDLLSHAGVSDDDVEAIAQTADYLARMSTTPVALLVFFGAGGLCLGSCVRDVAVSRSVSDAAAAGASRKAVPTPQQVESITTVRFKRLWWFLFFGAAPSAFVLIPMAMICRARPLCSHWRLLPSTSGS